jgi:DNA invertase Pin-like site-specific DNA recombinase
MAKQHRFEIVHEYGDVICGAKSKRPGLDQLMADARRRRFDIVLVASFDRLARSVRHFLEVLLNHLGIEFVSFSGISIPVAHLSERWSLSWEPLRNSNEV